MIIFRSHANVTRRVTGTDDDDGGGGGGRETGVQRVTKFTVYRDRQGRSGGGGQ